MTTPFQFVLDFVLVCPFAATISAITAITVELQLMSTPFTASAVLKAKDDIHITMP
jgi:hypothetical protein